MVPGLIEFDFFENNHILLDALPPATDKRLTYTVHQINNNYNPKNSGHTKHSLFHLALAFLTCYWKVYNLFHFNFNLYLYKY